MPPNTRSPDCRATLRILLPSRTQAPVPPKLMLLSLLKAFCSFAASCSGGARNSPSTTSRPMSRSPAMSTVPHRRATEIPVARITVISLPRANEPSPTSAPISTVTGSRSKACCGRFINVNQIALTTVYCPTPMSPCWSMNTNSAPRTSSTSITRKTAPRIVRMR